MLATDPSIINAIANLRQILVDAKEEIDTLEKDNEKVRASSVLRIGEKGMDFFAKHSLICFVLSNCQQLRDENGRLSYRIKHLVRTFEQEQSEGGATSESTTS